jgi:hypothetical protein
VAVRRENELPRLRKFNRLVADVQRWEPKMLKCEPIRENARNEVEDPNSLAFMMDINEPRRIRPYTDAADPKRVEARTLKQDPI